MIPNFIISFRETLEATLIVGIVLSYLNHSRQPARTTQAQTEQG